MKFSGSFFHRNLGTLGMGKKSTQVGRAASGGWQVLAVAGESFHHPVRISISTGNRFHRLVVPQAIAAIETFTENS